jgi:hypothetical protein
MDHTTARRYAGNLQQWGGTRLVTLADGAERGVRAVEFRTTAGLEFAVLVDRGMDVAWARYRGRSIAWHSPTGFVAPAFREPGGLGFLRSFAGGLFTTSGLDHILFPQDDPNDTYNYPASSGGSYGLHGRIANTPASLRGYGERWDGDRCVLFAEGEVRQSAALAENLTLRRRVETTLDGTSISWTDTVVNEGHYPGPHMLLYHINLGAPLLDPACRLVLPSRQVRWQTPGGGSDEGTHLRIDEPRAGFVEQAYEHDLRADADGRVRVALVNERDAGHPWGVQLTYDRAVFPYFFQWRLLDAGNYVLGFEPATNNAEGRAAARAAGELTLLEPGGSRTCTTRIAVLDGPDECAAAIRQVDARPEA